MTGNLKTETNNKKQCTAAKFIRERTIIGSVSYRNRYWVYRI